ncbi:hypothetical protein QTP81_09885 [Alteromonas sp. ASW11-36]|uniref:Uncharacterized protein n=1 Tax=Alteromonas arenosi TaxID=3055817 RepID=A0ABT7SXI3_9ALTE|nr:hypothetical protein [Alteromonas sp. ASW11-36]MDM7860905.1 hypothetical protein [Alteromonas sp. ASW11-36]
MKQASVDLLIIAAPADKNTAEKLSARLLAYKLPKRLADKQTQSDTRYDRITSAKISFNYPIGSPGAKEALKSQRLILVCSPNAPKSKEVSRWLSEYLAENGYHNLLCLIVDGEPNATDKGLPPDLECFPNEVKHKVDKNGILSAERFEPIAADARATGDGEKRAFHKLIAGLFKVRFADIEQRLKKRKQKQLAVAFAVVIAVVGFLIQLHMQNLREQESAQRQYCHQLVSEAFSLVNQAQYDSAQKVLTQLRSLEACQDQVSLFQVLAERINAAFPNSQLVSEKGLVDHLMTSPNRMVLAGLVEEDEAFVLVVNTETATKKFEIKGVTGYSSLWGSYRNTPGRMIAASLSNERFWFVLAKGEGKWQLSNVDLITGELTQFPIQQSAIYNQFANLQSEFSTATLYSLNNGWIIHTKGEEVVLQDFATDTTVFLPKRFQDSFKNVESDVWFDPQLPFMFFTDPQSNALIAWHMKDNKWQALTSLQNVTSIRFTDESLKYLLINKSEGIDQDQIDYVEILNTRDLSTTRFDNISLFKAVDLAQSIFVGENHEDMYYGLVNVDFNTTHVRWLRRNNRWHYGIQSKLPQLYIQNDPQQIARVEPQKGTDLVAIPTQCVESHRIDHTGRLHCLADKKVWKVYDILGYSPQSNHVVRGKISEAVNTTLYTLVLSNEASGGNVSVIDWRGDQVNYSHQLDGQCFGRIIGLSDKQFLISSRVETFNEFFGQCSSVTAGTQQNPFDLRMNVLEVNDNVPAVNESIIDHLQAHALITGNFMRKGIFINDNEFAFNWESDNFAWASAKTDALFKGRGVDVLYHIEHAESQRALTITTNKQEPPLYQIWESHTGSEQSPRLLQSSKLEESSLFQVGFSPTGALYWHSAFNSEDKKIYWYKANDSIDSSFLPNEFRGAGFLRFSRSGKYLMQTELIPNFTVKFYNISNGEMVYEGTGRQDIEFHNSRDYVRLDSKVFQIKSSLEPLNFEYMEDINVTNLHPSEAKAAATCGINACVIDLESGHVIYKAKNLVPASNVLFLSNDQITYTTGNHNVVQETYAYN